MLQTGSQSSVLTGQVFDLSKDPEKVKEAMKRCYRILIEEKIEWEEKQKEEISAASGRTDSRWNNHG